MTQEKIFYLVWNPTTGYTYHRHDNIADAKMEAQRLSLNNKGKEFVVLEPVVKLKSVEVIETTYDSIPF